MPKPRYLLLHIAFALGLALFLVPKLFRVIDGLPQNDCGWRVERITRSKIVSPFTGETLDDLRVDIVGDWWYEDTFFLHKTTSTEEEIAAAIKQECADKIKRDEASKASQLEEKERREKINNLLK